MTPVRRVPLGWEGLPAYADQTYSFCGHLLVAVSSNICWLGLQSKRVSMALGSAIRTLAIPRIAGKGPKTLHCDFNTLEDSFPLGREAVACGEDWIFLPTTVILVFDWVSLGGWETASSVGQYTCIYNLSPS